MSLRLWLPLNGTSKNFICSDGIRVTRYGKEYYQLTEKGKVANYIGDINDYYIIENTPVIGNNFSFSIAYWFYTTKPQETMAFYNGRTTTDSAFSIFAYQGNFRYDESRQCSFNNFPIPANEWHHYCFTRDKKNISFYVDGVLKQTYQSMSNFSVNIKYATILRSSDCVNGNFGLSPYNLMSGKLLDYRIYDECLGEEAVKALAKCELVHLPLNSGFPQQTNSTIDYDNSGFRNNGKFINGYPNIVTNEGTISNRCYEFSSDNNIRYVINSPFESQTNIPKFSVSIWFKSKAASAGQTIFSLDHSKFLAASIQDNKTLRITANGTPTDINTGNIDLINSNNLHLLTCVKNNNSLLVYLNKTLISTIALTNLVTGGDWYLASPDADLANTAHRFIGLLYDFRFCVSALTQEDINRMYEVKSRVTNNGQLLSYSIDEKDNGIKVNTNGTIESSNFIENTDISNVKFYEDAAIAATKIKII